MAALSQSRQFGRLLARVGGAPLAIDWAKLELASAGLLSAALCRLFVRPFTLGLSIEIERVQFVVYFCFALSAN